MGVCSMEVFKSRIGPKYIDLCGLLHSPLATSVLLFVYIIKSQISINFNNKNLYLRQKAIYM